MERGVHAARHFLLEHHHPPRGQCQGEHDAGLDHSAATEPGHTRLQGVELEASGRISNSNTLSGGYEYIDATVTSFTVDPALAGMNPSLVGLQIPKFRDTRISRHVTRGPSSFLRCKGGSESASSMTIGTLCYSGAISCWTLPLLIPCVAAWTSLSRWKICSTNASTWVEPQCLLSVHPSSPGAACACSSDGGRPLRLRAYWMRIEPTVKSIQS